jgi:hypothetical protein
MEYESNGSLSSSIKYTYDNNGNEVEITIILYLPEGKDTFKTNYKYNEDNQIIEKIDFQNNTYINSETKYKYIYLNVDSNKNWTKKIEFKNGKPNLIIERKVEYFKKPIT